MGAKLVLGVVWLYTALCFVAPLPGASAGRWLFGLLLVVHAVECVAFLPRLRAAPGSLGGHLVQTLLFGVLHVRSLPAAA